MKKQLLALVVALSLVVPASVHAMAGGIDVTTLKNQGKELKQYVAANVLPVIGELVNALNNGDFNKFEQTLQANAGKLDLAPIINFFQSSLPEFKKFLFNALNNPDYVKAIMEKIPAQYQSQVNTAKATLLSNLSIIDTIGQQLSNLRGINIGAQIPALVNALRTVAASPQFATLKPELITFYNNQIKPFADQIQTIDFDRIADTAGNAFNAVIKGQTPDLVSLISGIGLTRKALPVLAGFLQNLAVFVSRIAKVQGNLPPQIQQAVDTIEQNSGAVFKAIASLNQEINKSLGK